MPREQDDPQRTVAALMAASRAFAGITARSLAALSAFAEAAGEASEQEWWLGFAADGDARGW